MYCLPQAGILANKLLQQRLASKGYYPCQHRTGLWHHVWRPITFCLVIDDFGIKSTHKSHVLHLKAALEEHYSVTIDWTGSLFIGITLTWDYVNCFVDLHMPLNIDKAVLKYQHPAPLCPQYVPYKHTPIQYGTNVQRVLTNSSPPLTPKAVKRVQDIVGTLLYYAQAVDGTLLTALSAIAAQQSKGTKAVTEACMQLLDYVAMHPNAGIRYKTCDIILSVPANASYLSKMGGKSRASGHFYLT
jgi:hypothetical protein